MTIYSLLGAFLFSAYIVYDVHLLIAREYPFSSNHAFLTQHHLHATTQGRVLRL